MKIQRLFLLIVCLLLMRSFSFSQTENKPQDTSKVGLSGADTYSATVGNVKRIPFRINYAQKPVVDYKGNDKPEITKINLDGSRTRDGFVFEIDSVSRIEKTDEATKSKNIEFEYVFVPQQAGQYEIILKGSDGGRKDKFGIATKTVMLKVENPSLADPETLTKLQNVCEKETNTLNFSVQGFPDSSKYKILIKTAEGREDSVKGNLLTIGRNAFRAGTRLNISVLYAGSIMMYYDGSKVTETNFEINVRRRDIKVVWTYAEGAEVQLGTGILFKAKKACNDFTNGEAVDPGEIDVVITDEKKMLLAGKLDAQAETFKIPLRMRGEKKIGKNGVDIEVSLTVVGARQPFKKKYTIIKDEKK